MYLVDLKVNRFVRSIASVSGGSIVNGVVGGSAVHLILLTPTSPIVSRRLQFDQLSIEGCSGRQSLRQTM